MLTKSAEGFEVFFLVKLTNNLILIWEKFFAIFVSCSQVILDLLEYY